MKSFWEWQEEHQGRWHYTLQFSLGGNHSGMTCPIPLNGFNDCSLLLFVSMVYNFILNAWYLIKPLIAWIFIICKRVSVSDLTCKIKMLPLAPPHFRLLLSWPFSGCEKEGSQWRSLLRSRQLLTRLVYEAVKFPSFLEENYVSNSSVPKLEQATVLEWESCYTLIPTSALSIYSIHPSV